MKNLYKSGLIVLALLSTFFTRAQVPTFNSYPSASAAVFLDFDGHLVTGTAWNINGPFTCNSSGLNDTQITEVFNRVAEDFRPFNINVTTSETNFNLAASNRRIRVIITTSHEWYGTGAGGVAFISSFNAGADNPAFVFSALFGFNVKNIAEASSHETGHSMGLRHQSTYNASCVKTSEYNWGTGTGEIGWAPIMGAAYGQNMTLWHNGPSSTGCNNFQTELSIITNASNGFGFRNDDHTDVFATATTASFTNNQFTISGVVENTDDKDLFKFIIPEFGRFQLSAVPYNVGTGNSGSDLDLQVEFLDASFNPLGVYNPGTILSSVIDSLVDGGTYYLRIDGKGNIYAPEYGSLGSFSLQGIFTAGVPLALRKLELRGQVERDIHTLNWLIDADEAVIKQIVEVSVDGRNFMALNEPNSFDRTFSYRPADNRPLRYRLNVTFDNHRQYYSNVITIRQGTLVKPQLIGNTITNNSIAVNSPAIYQYQIIDQSGRMLNKGTLVKGFSSISSGNIPQGIYIIRFSNGDEQWTEKFIKK